MSAGADFRARTLYVIRHGQTQENAAGLLTGQNDSPLTDLGRAQARKNGVLLKELASDLSRLDFFASSLHRACTTMEILRDGAGLPPLAYRADRRLMEADMGDWSGAVYDDLKVIDKARWDARENDRWNWVMPNGESYAQLHERVGAFLQTLRRDSVIVCHQGSARAIRSHYLRLSVEHTVRYTQPNAGIMKLSEGVESYWGD
ncbi:MAG: histidine phosphatase family protein [Proteobacteria bacterium]|nr:histidine phosphatase family protein [Pseudomonadota bacterium]